MQRKKIKNKMTLDKLALMIGKGFGSMDERFNMIGGDILLIKEDINTIKTKLDSLERRIICIEDILTEHGRDIRKMKNDIELIKAELQEIKKSDNGNSDKIFELDQRVKVLEVKIG